MGVDERLALYASEFRGNGLDRHTLNPETGRFEREEPVFSWEKPLRTSDVQVWNATGEFDAPGLALPTRICFTVFDEIPGRIQDTIGTPVLEEAKQDSAWIDIRNRPGTSGNTSSEPGRLPQLRGQSLQHPERPLPEPDRSRSGPTFPVHDARLWNPVPAWLWLDAPAVSSPATTTTARL